jgi:hypothetical protein
MGLTISRYGTVLSRGINRGCKMNLKGVGELNDGYKYRKRELPVALIHKRKSTVSA